MIETDNNDEDDTVFVFRKPGENKTAEGFRYHIDPDCQYLDTDNDVVEYSRKGAQVRWKSPCIGCVLTDYSYEDFNYSR